MHTRPVYHRRFEPFEYFIPEGSKAKFNIRPSLKPIQNQHSKKSGVSF